MSNIFLTEPLCLSDVLLGALPLLERFAQDFDEGSEIRAEIEALIEKMQAVRQLIDEQPLQAVSGDDLPECWRTL